MKNTEKGLTITWKALGPDLLSVSHFFVPTFAERHTSKQAIDGTRCWSFPHSLAIGYGNHEPPSLWAVRAFFLSFAQERELCQQVMPLQEYVLETAIREVYSNI